MCWTGTAERTLPTVEVVPEDAPEPQADKSPAARMISADAALRVAKMRGFLGPMWVAMLAAAPTASAASSLAAVVDTRRRIQVIVMLLIVLAALVVIAFVPRPKEPAAAPASQAAAGTTPAVHRHPKARSAPRAAVNLGEAEGHLPQTEALPSSSTARFHSQMQSLWEGVVHDESKLAKPSFFPRSAYEQLKAIANAGSDWENRLFAEFTLDIGAAHELIAADPAGAKLLEVRVDGAYAHWVPPGVCANSIGYYEVPNSRVVYEYQGAEHSFGIASMISWRGVWYVVHFGSVLREGSTGVVDEAATGPGTSAYSGTC